MKKSTPYLIVVAIIVLIGFIFLREGISTSVSSIIDNPPTATPTLNAPYSKFLYSSENAVVHTR
jgi:hypothetical protein